VPRSLPAGATGSSSLDNLQAALAPLLVDPSGRAVSSADAFDGRTPGPGRPLAPSEPRGSEPRSWFPWAGYNLSYVPRREFRDLTPFQMLRNLADLCDVVRICLEDVKQQVVGFGYDFKARDEKSQAQTSELAAVRKFWRRPDGENHFDSWLTRALEDVLVIDALSFYRWRTKGGDPFALQLLDGATIKPIVDFRGIPPAPPVVAYQQIISGRVESEFTRPWHDAQRRQPDGKPKVELVYAPRHPRTFSPYGQSNVERIVMTLNMLLRRQHMDLAFYTSGNIPDAFWKCPEGWTASQIEEAQKLFDELLSGNADLRSKLKLMPGGQGTGLENPRGDDKWSYEFMEWFGRIVCWCFGVSFLPIGKMVNRATSEQADASETDSGTKPLQKFLKTRIDTEIEEFLGYAGIEFIWKDEKQADERLQMEKNIGYVGAGIYKIDEVRETEGKKPIGAPPFTETGAGLVKLGPELEIVGAKAGPQATGNGAPPAAAGSAAEVLAAAPKIPVLDRLAAPGLTRAAQEDLKRWRKVALKDLEKRRERRAFETTAIPGVLHTAISEWLEHASAHEDVLWGFRAITRARRPLLMARKRIRLELGLRAEALAHFRDRAPEIAALALRYYQESAQERSAWTEGRDGQPPDDEIDQAMRWDVFQGKVEPRLADAFADGGTLAEQQIPGEGISFGLLDEAATTYAEERAAELVGMRRLEDGSLVKNPDSKWAVSKTVRDRIHDTVAKATEEGWTGKQLAAELESGTIWEARADMIARTEVAIAVNQGAAETYRAAGVETGTVLDGPGCLEDGHDDGQRGVNGETWALAKFQQYPVGHPHCRRDFAANVEEAREAA